MATRGLCNRFDDVWLLDGVRTPQVDYCGAFAGVNPIDLGIKAARAVLARTGLELGDIARFEINEAQGAQTLAVQRFGLRGRRAGHRAAAGAPGRTLRTSPS
jgi:hypothetical protein